jgi:CRISPR system Cascade subunit CasE
MIYLSKIPLNPKSRQVKSDMGNLYEIHRTIMQAFPKDQDRKNAAVLFRLENKTSGTPPSLTVLVQSKIKPDWQFLQETNNYLAEASVQVKEFSPIIKQSDVFRYVLCANPTLRKSDTKKLVPIVKESELMDWILSKGVQYGFKPELASLMIQKQPPVVLYKKQDGKIHKINLAMTDFTGILKVQDPEKFYSGLTTGIGRGRSFGCGLLSIARL